MNFELNKRFNEEINGYRKSLLFYAKKCDWDTFKVNAGRMFDYVESIEMALIERKFFQITKAVVAVLIFLVILILKMAPELHPKLARANELMILAAIATCCFEVYFFYNFRMYMKGKMNYYKKRRDKFIRNIESDFRNSSASITA